MKRACVALIALASLAMGQAKPFTYRDASGDLTVSANAGKLKLVDKNYVLNLVGQVTLNSKSKGIAMRADTVDATLAPGKVVQVKTITATKNVTLSKTDGGRSSTITGAKAVLTSGTLQDSVAISGPVNITSVNAKQKQSLNASGSRGTADLANGKDQRGTVQAAELFGPVKVTLIEVDKEGKESKILLTGDRMSLTTGKDSSTVVVTGNVNIKGASVGEASNLNKATFTLNASGEIVGWEAN